MNSKKLVIIILLLVLSMVSCTNNGDNRTSGEKVIRGQVLATSIESSNLVGTVFLTKVYLSDGVVLYGTGELNIHLGGTYEFELETNSITDKLWIKAIRKV